MLVKFASICSSAMDLEGGEDVGNSAGVVDGSSLGNLLLLLHAVKKEILEEIHNRADALHKDIAEMIDTMSTSVVNKVISGVSSRTLVQAGSTRSRSSDEWKRKAPPTMDKLPFYDLLLQKEKTPFVVQWTIVTTLYSFAFSNRPAFAWIPQAAVDQMNSHRLLFDGASGLSVLFFAVGPEQSWSRYHGKVGKLWSFVLRSSITSTILHLRTNDFDTANTPPGKSFGRSVPEWMASFGGRKQTAGTVNETIQCLETTDEMTRRSGDADLARRRKRMRMQHEPPRR